MKKITTIILFAVLAVFLFASCDAILITDTSAPQESVPAQSDAQQETQSNASGTDQNEQPTSQSQPSSSQSEAESEPQSETTTPASAYSTTLADIMKKGELLIGIDNKFAPMSFVDESGELVGFDIDMASAVCEELGVTPKFVPINWAQKEELLNSGEIDVIWSGLSITASRQQTLSFSGAYLKNILLVASSSQLQFRSVDEMIGFKIGVQEESAALEALQAVSVYDALEADIVTYANYDEAIAAMQSGAVDCVVVDEVYFLYNSSISTAGIAVSPMDFGNDYYAVGLRVADTELTNQINLAIGTVTNNGTLGDISVKWFGSERPLV